MGKNSQQTSPTNTTIQQREKWAASKRAKRASQKGGLKQTPLVTITLELDIWGNLLTNLQTVDPEKIREELDSLNKEDGYENSHTIAGGVRLFEEVYNKLNQDLMSYIKAT